MQKQTQFMLIWAATSRAGFCRIERLHSSPTGLLVEASDETQSTTLCYMQVTQEEDEAGRLSEHGMYIPGTNEIRKYAAENSADSPLYSVTTLNKLEDTAADVIVAIMNRVVGSRVMPVLACNKGYRTCGNEIDVITKVFHAACGEPAPIPAVQVASHTAPYMGGIGCYL